MEKHHIHYCHPNTLTPYAGNARSHSKKQIKAVARSIENFGFNAPVLVDSTDTLIAGHARVEAAKLLRLDAVPVIRLTHLSEPERRAYILADNKLALKAEWNPDLLAAEVQYLLDAELEIDLTGFEMAEIDLVLDEDAERTGRQPDPEDLLTAPDSTAPVVTRPADRWRLGRHTVVCGDARDPDSYAQLLQEAKADLVFTDPPYNLEINGHVSGLGRAKHREFAMASGEMQSDEFNAFLKGTLLSMRNACRPGAILYVCMDWRHIQEITTAAHACELELKNVCVWNKTNGGMGSFYRSKHELIFVFKIGGALHVNNFELGQHGRYRTNVWDYAGVNTFRQGRDQDLAAHPTVKPVALVADAIKDCSKRDDIVLDAFGGSGTTLIACEKTGRNAYLLEIDRAYVDLTIRRWQFATGKVAMHETGQSFDDIAEQRTDISQPNLPEVA
jgi:DNA modification methylase